MRRSLPSCKFNDLQRKSILRLASTRTNRQSRAYAEFVPGCKPESQKPTTSLLGVWLYVVRYRVCCRPASACAHDEWHGHSAVKGSVSLVLEITYETEAAAWVVRSPGAMELWLRAGFLPAAAQRLEQIDLQPHELGIGGRELRIDRHQRLLRREQVEIAR